MSKHELINIEAAVIIRNEVVRVFDEEGDERFSFPASLSDAEVKGILRQMNAAYAAGFECGSYDVCWHDIWPQFSMGNLDEMEMLERKYPYRCQWQGSWGKEQCEKELINFIQIEGEIEKWLQRV